MCKIPAELTTVCITVAAVNALKLSSLKTRGLLLRIRLANFSASLEHASNCNSEAC